MRRLIWFMLLVVLSNSGKASFTRLRSSKGWPIQRTAAATCYFSRRHPQCNSWSTCTANRVRFGSKLSALHSYVTSLMDVYDTTLDDINIRCGSVNLTQTDSIDQASREQLSNEPPSYRYATLITYYIYNLGSVINYIDGDFTFFPSSRFPIRNFTSRNEISIFNDLYNITSLGVCGESTVRSPEMITIFPPLTRESSFNPFHNTVKSYCMLCEFCHTIRHFYHLVTGMPLDGACSSCQ